ncbi:MAG: NAD(P)-binding protein, partial [Acidobacteria bacterium]|nr:NAD(P)-binding protein [Acidobacteriota bacterium]
MSGTASCRRRRWKTCRRWPTSSTPAVPDADIGVAVVGGGISGLAAAYELHLCGVGHVVLEGGTRFGGVIRTDRVDGFTIDGGPD